MFRRDVSLFAKSLKYAVIIGCLFLAVCAGAAFVIAGSEAGGSKALTLALVNEDTDSSFSDFVLNIIATNENISSAVKVEFYETEAEAVEAVRGGAAAALIIPQDFFASVNYGENYPCRIVLNDANLSAAKTVSHFAGLGSDMLSSAQYAIYEGDLFLQEKGADDNVRTEYNYRLNTAMVSEVANAPEQYFHVTDLGYTTRGLSRTAHYLVLFLCFFFGLLSVCFFHLYRDDCEKSILIRLFSAGVSKKAFMFWKTILPGMLFALISLAVILILRNRIAMTVSIAGVLLSLAGLAFLSYLCACAGLSFGDSSGAVLFVIFFISLFFCGGIIPYSSLSQTVLAAGRFTPLGVSYAFFSPLFGGSFDPAVIIAAVLYTVIGTVMTSVTLKKTVLGRETV